MKALALTERITSGTLYPVRYGNDLEAKRLPAQFYQSITGSEPARNWLKGLPVADRRIVGRDIKTVEFGWPVGMPTCRPFGAGLWEIRSSLPDGRIARMLFCISDDRMILLHGFIKKTRTTPTSELKLARSRQKEVLR